MDELLNEADDAPPLESWPQRNVGDAPLQLRRASDRTPLGRTLGGIEYAYGTGHMKLAAQLLEEGFLEAWFGLSSERFLELVQGLAEYSDPEQSFVPNVALFVAAQDTVVNPKLVDLLAIAGGNAGSEPAALVSLIYRQRMLGNVRDALDSARSLNKMFEEMRPRFEIDRGWTLFASVQLGVSAMLAGEFVEALDAFAAARTRSTVASLSFLSRDACVRAALIEALYGDIGTAQSLLQESKRYARTESWCEEVIDVSEQIAESMLATEGNIDSLAKLEAIPMNQLGEMWCFYLVALNRCLIADGRTDEARRSLKMFEQLPLPQHAGDGFLGSAVDLSTGLRAMSEGAIIEARVRFERADQRLDVTQLLLGALDLIAGRPRAAIEQVLPVRKEASRLRQLNLWRLSTLAGGHLALGEKEQCLVVLEAVVQSSTTLSLQDVSYFARDVREFAAANIASWPTRFSANLPKPLHPFPEKHEVLTPRENEVLVALSTGASREQIAASQYISINTLKAHLRSLYKKLGVNSRTAAVIEGERRGLF